MEVHFTAVSSNGLAESAGYVAGAHVPIMLASNGEKERESRVVVNDGSEPVRICLRLQIHKYWLAPITHHVQLFQNDMVTAAGYLKGPISSNSDCRVGSILR